MQCIPGDTPGQRCVGEQRQMATPGRRFRSCRRVDGNTSRERCGWLAALGCWTSPDIPSSMLFHRSTCEKWPMLLLSKFLASDISHILAALFKVSHGNAFRLFTSLWNRLSKNQTEFLKLALNLILPSVYLVKNS